MSRVYEETSTKLTIASTTETATPGRVSDTPPSQTASNGTAAPMKPSRTAPRRLADNAQPRDTSSGRDANGRFSKGNPGGPGNPFARQTAALRRELLAAVTADDLCQVAKRLVQLAKNGDVAAAKLLLSYTIGTPTPAPDPDTLDQHEWQVLHRQAEPIETAHFMRSVPTEAACAVARAAKPSWPSIS